MLHRTKMILNFSVENYGPFKERTVLDFRPSKLSDPEDNILSSEGFEALSSISIFGPNASGKSRMLHAIGALTNIIRFPLPANVPIPWYDPFRFDPETSKAPTTMSISIVEKGVEYDYSVSFDSQRILSEELYHSPNGVRSKVFVRKGNSISVTTTPSGRKLSRMRQVVGDNSSFISIAAQFNHDVCLRVNRAVSRIVVLTGDMSSMLNTTIMKMNSDPEFKEKLISSLNVADFSISDVNGDVRQRHVKDMTDIIPERIAGLMMASGNSKVDETVLDIVHSVDTEGLSDGDRTLPYLMESNGTVRMLCIMGPVIETLRSGGFVAIDEFASFLDDSICRWIIGLFRSDRNPNCSQLLINTHDQLLMDTYELFRRDQIYLVSKTRGTQTSSMRSLSEYSLRKDYNPRKGFSLGKFGSRPVILDEGWSDFKKN